ARPLDQGWKEHLVCEGRRDCAPQSARRLGEGRGKCSRHCGGGASSANLSSSPRCRIRRRTPMIDVSYIADDVSLDPSVATARHACQLLSTLLASGFEGKELVVGDLQDEYRGCAISYA